MQKLFYGFILMFSVWACNDPEQQLSSDFDPVHEAYNRNSSRDRLFDTSWKFHQGDITNGELPDLDDADWRLVTLPHDWSIEDLPNQDADSVIGPFSKASVGGPSTGHVIGGIGWYRKTFNLSPEDKDQQVFIRFDGIYRNSEVWINGHFLGTHPNGYMPFYFNITSFLNDSGPNTMAVKVNNLGENSRWYTGSGIYRHVWLSVVDPIHFDVFGVNVITGKTGDNEALLNIEAVIKNEGSEDQEVLLKADLLSPDGRKVASTENQLSLNQPEHQSSFDLTVDDPDLWSPESPNLYLLELSILKNGKTLDQYCQTFGIRTIAYSSEDGLLLNGKSYLIKGGCMHHDNGPLGAAAIDRAEYRRVELMKAYGFNGIRTAHNPPSPQFLDACDQLGMLVIDEAFDMWLDPKKPQDYSNDFREWWKRDLQSLVRRDRNHPSVIIWSIGNEIYERTDSTGLALTKVMTQAVKEEDLSRPVTEALCLFWQRPGKPWEDNYPGYRLLDVGGYNYEWRRYEEDHEEMPDLVMIGTESLAKEACESWTKVEELPYVIGDFVWTAMDYMGESGIGSALYEPPAPPLPWPWFNGFCGDIDLIGNKKPQSHYRDVVWRISPIEMAVHQPIPAGKKEYVTKWGWPDERQSWSWQGHEGEKMSVNVYTRHEEVHLKLNGKVIGQSSTGDSLVANFSIPYESGTLTAIGLTNGQPKDSISLITVGKPVKLLLEPDQLTITPDFNDLVYVSITVSDAEGRRIPYYNDPLKFEVNGGELVAVGNGNPTDLKSFTQPDCDAYKGRCLAILRSRGTPGEVFLTVKGEGLRSASISIPVR